jgi:hypothetical protein
LEKTTTNKNIVGRNKKQNIKKNNKKIPIVLAVQTQHRAGQVFGMHKNKGLGRKA